MDFGRSPKGTAGDDMDYGAYRFAFGHSNQAVEPRNLVRVLRTVVGSAPVTGAYLSEKNAKQVAVRQSDGSTNGTPGIASE
jgi:hypothetical protein